MPSFNRIWASNATAPTDITEPDATEAEAGHDTSDPPDHRWDNWWQNRVDVAMQSIERFGALPWYADVPFSVAGITVYHGGNYYLLLQPDTGTEPGTDSAVWQQIPGLGKPAIISNYKAGGRVFVREQTDPDYVELTTQLTQTTDETVGPDGSGADYEWSALNAPAAQGAKGIMVMCTLYLPTVGSGYTFAAFRAISNDVVSSTVDDTKAQFDVVASGAGEDWSQRQSGIFIPLDSNGIFKAFWHHGNTTASRWVRLWVEGIVL